MNLYSAKIQFLFLLLFSSILIGCGPSQDILNSAIDRVNETMKPQINQDWILKDFEVQDAKKESLSKADKLNGITERWKIRLIWLVKKPGGEWIQYAGRVTISRKNGKCISSHLSWG